jgi:hypothetical protein
MRRIGTVARASIAVVRRGRSIGPTRLPNMIPPPSLVSHGRTYGRRSQGFRTGEASDQPPPPDNASFRPQPRHGFFHHHGICFTKGCHPSRRPRLSRGARPGRRTTAVRPSAGKRRGPSPPRGRAGPRTSGDGRDPPLREIETIRVSPRLGLERVLQGPARPKSGEGCHHEAGRTTPPRGPAGVLETACLHRGRDRKRKRLHRRALASCRRWPGAHRSQVGRSQRLNLCVAVGWPEVRNLPGGVARA